MTDDLNPYPGNLKHHKVDKKKQRKLLADMMHDDARSGLYEVAGRETIQSDERELYTRLFLYDAASGFLIWKYRPMSDFKTSQAWMTWNKRFAGKLAGTPNNEGYWHVRINRRLVKAHRIAWIISVGQIPSGACIDHINGDTGDNRLENLRIATHRENCRNQKMRTKNTSGFKGVFWHDRTGKWQAKIRDGQKQRSLGLFDTIEEAARAYANAANELHGRFARPSSFAKPSEQ